MFRITLALSKPLMGLYPVICIGLKVKRDYRSRRMWQHWRTATTSLRSVSHVSCRSHIYPKKRYPSSRLMIDHVYPVILSRAARMLGGTLAPKSCDRSNALYPPNIRPRTKIYTDMVSMQS